MYETHLIDSLHYFALLHGALRCPLHRGGVAYERAAPATILTVSVDAERHAVTVIHAVGVRHRMLGRRLAVSAPELHLAVLESLIARAMASPFLVNRSVQCVP